MDRAEATGRNVNEAIDHALLQLGKTRQDVDIQVITEGSRGLLGIVGAEDARVVVTVRPTAPAASAETPAGTVAPRYPTGQRRLSVSPQSDPKHREAGPIPTPPNTAVMTSAPPPANVVAVSDETEDDQEGGTEPEITNETVVAEAVPERDQEPPDQELVDTAVDVVEALLRHMRVEAETEVRSLDYPLTINITGDDLGLLIGRRGETLSALQFIVNLMVGRRLKRWVRVVVDVEDYRLRREHALRDLAAKAAGRVRRFRQPVTLEAMPPNERRIVHLTLQSDRFVSTHSIGTGDERRVVISPRSR